MRKFAALLFCTVALFGCLIRADAAAVLEDKTLEGTAGTFAVDITLEDEAPVKAAAVSKVTYDKSRFTLVSGQWLLEESPFMKSDYPVDDEDPMAVMAYEEAADCNGAIFRLEFKINSGAKAGTSQVSCVFQSEGVDTVEVKEATVTLTSDAPGLSRPVQIALWVTVGLAAAVVIAVVIVVVLRRKKK